MQKRYLVISTWSDKTTGMPKSTLAEISEGINKNGKPYAITQTDRATQADEFYEIGTILSYNMTLNNTSDTPSKK